MKSTRSVLLVLTSLFLGLSSLAAADAAGAKSGILAAYAKVSAALAADNLADAKAAATALATTAGPAANQPIADQATAVAKAADIAAARKSFKTLSATVEPLAAGEKGYTVMHCPMANADWVQSTGDVRNPYFGKAMLTCGEPKKVN